MFPRNGAIFAQLFFGQIAVPHGDAPMLSIYFIYTLYRLYPLDSEVDPGALLIDAFGSAMQRWSSADLAL